MMADKMKDFIRPDLPSRCTWRADADPASSPHTKRSVVDRDQILPNILHAIGRTPLVKLNHIPASMGIKCEVLVKCEYMNPGGSVKDRIGFRMIEDAEQSGRLKPGAVLIEPTSGNTGIGLAMGAAVKGYRCIIVMPEKMSDEKVDTLRSLGAEIVRTPTAAAFDSPEGLIAVAQRINKEIPNSVILDQYRNSGNPLAHYDTTIEEILTQTGGKVDCIVATAGTGGTVTGIGRKLKEKCPTCKFVAVDPEGSILAEPTSINKTDVTYYEVEGIGYDFIPTVLDRSVVDSWEKTRDKESLTMTRRLIKEEGLLCGGSSGSAVVAALRVAAKMKEGERLVVLLPDGIRNYMTKLVSDQWMMARDFMTEEPISENWWWNHKVSLMKLQAPLTVLPSVTCQEALDILKSEGFDQLPVVDEDGTVQGVVTTGNLMAKLVNLKVKATDSVNQCLYRQFRKITLEATLGHVSKILEKDHFVLVVHSQKRSDASHQNVQTREVIIGIITPVDLLSFITAPKEGSTAGKEV